MRLPGVAREQGIAEDRKSKLSGVHERSKEFARLGIYVHTASCGTAPGLSRARFKVEPIQI